MFNDHSPIAQILDMSRPRRGLTSTICVIPRLDDIAANRHRNLPWAAETSPGGERDRRPKSHDESVKISVEGAYVRAETGWRVSMAKRATLTAWDQVPVSMDHRYFTGVVLVPCHHHVTVPISPLGTQVDTASPGIVNRAPAIAFLASERAFR